MKTQRHRLAPAAFRAGFTLVELLVVITIIALMLGVLTPAYNKILANVIRKQVRTMLAGLEAGCKQYKSEACGGGSYPPAGAANLIKYLTGKGMAAEKDKAGTNYIEVPGGGFQMAKGGRIYGPYIDLNPKSISASGTGFVITDPYSSQIGYYVRQPSTTTFDGGGAPNIPDPASYCRQTAGGPQLVDMFCSSPGANRTYGTAIWDASSRDDIVTFVSEE